MGTRRNLIRGGTLALVAILLILGIGSAQQDPVIGPGDVLSIIVIGEPGLSGAYTVRGDGVIVFPLIGEVTAVGATPKELADRLVAALKRYLKNPRVQVSFQQVVPRKLFVHVLGQVLKPGSYEFQPGLSLAEVLAQAGGPTTRAALRKAVVIRKKTQIPVDLEALLMKGNASRNVLLEPGDVIVVPQLEDRVHVLGEVARPGYYDLKEGDRLLDVIQKAGWFTPKAGPDRISIVRKNTTIQVNLKDLLLLRGNPDQNIPIEPNDVIIVSQSEDRVHILGEVTKPGYYDLKEGDRLLDVIQKAGWFTPKAGPDRISVMRNGSQQIKLDLVAFLQKGDGSQNVPMAPGDVIFVPETDNRAAVIGEVKNPGSYVVRPGMRVVSLLLDAGGPTDKANLKDVAIIRQVGGKSTVIRADVEKFLKQGGEGGLNLEVTAGDVVFVPERAKGFTWEGFFEWLNRLTFFLFLFK